MLGAGTMAEANDPPTNLLSILSSSSSSSSSCCAELKKWNDEVESNNFGLSSSSSSSYPSSKNEISNLTEHIGAASIALHGRLVETASLHPGALAGGNVTTFDTGGLGESAAAEEVGSYQKGDEPEDLQANVEASRAATAIMSSSGSTSQSNNGDGGTISAEDTVSLTSELLRSIKNLIRYYNTLRMMTGIGRFSRGSSDQDDDGDDSLRRLRSRGMLQLYSTILVGCSTASSVSNDDSSSKDDAARNSSLALFHSTYGTPDANPAATRARTVLIEEVKFVSVLMKLLLVGANKGRQNDQQRHKLSPPLMLSLVRHVHSLVGCNPKIVPDMDAALKNISTKNDNIDDGDGATTNLMSVLVTILSSTIDDSKNGPFPGTKPSDRRPDLVTEIMRVLFALRATGAVPAPSTTSKNDDDVNRQDSSDTVDYDTMTRIGEILCQLLKLPKDDRSHTSRLAAVNLLMDAPKGYARYLLNEGAIPALLLVFRIQTDEVIERRTGSFNSDAAALVPILAVLDRLSADDAEVQNMVKQEIFPPKEEEAYQAKAAEERAKGGGGRKGLGAKNMKPALELPPGTLRWKLVKLMTWPESNVKRCASELLWRICDCDATEFVLRTGFGNAVHMLGIKGLVQIPKESTTFS